MSNEPKPDDIVEVHVRWTETVEYAKTIHITRAKFEEYDKKIWDSKNLEEDLRALGCSNGDWLDSTVEDLNAFETAGSEASESETPDV